jgi:hypothetical protein
MTVDELQEQEDDLLLRLLNAGEKGLVVSHRRPQMRLASGLSGEIQVRSPGQFPYGHQVHRLAEHLIELGLASVTEIIDVNRSTREKRVRLTRKGVRAAHALKGEGQ